MKRTAEAVLMTGNYWWRPRSGCAADSLLVVQHGFHFLIGHAESLFIKQIIVCILCARSDVKRVLTSTVFCITYHPVGMCNQTEIAQWAQTKCKIVDAGVSLMRSRGFNATSLDEICQSAGVTKGGFFHYFKSKEEIAKAALARFMDNKAKKFAAAPFRKLSDPLDRVMGRLDFAMESFKPGRLTEGCLVGTLAQELSFTNPELRAICSASFERMARDFEIDLAEAKASRAPDSAIDPAGLATLYVTILQGSMLIAKAEQKNEVIVSNLRHLRQYIELLFGANRTANKKRGSKPASAVN